MGVKRLTARQLDELTAALDLDVYALPICFACLGMVAIEVEFGTEEKAKRAAAQLAPDLWAEGLALPVQSALERARRRGVPGAEAAIAIVEQSGARSSVVKEIVRSLATQLAHRTRAERVARGNGSGGHLLEFRSSRDPPPAA